MKYDAMKRLANHVDSILTGSCSRADVIEIKRLSRLVLEQRVVAHQYPMLSLYCSPVPDAIAVLHLEELGPAGDQDCDCVVWKATIDALRFTVKVHVAHVRFHNEAGE